MSAAANEHSPVPTTPLRFGARELVILALVGCGSIGLAKLAPLTQLTYINLSGTQVAASAVAPLRAMKNLRHIYLYNTPAQPPPAAQPAPKSAL